MANIESIVQRMGGPNLVAGKAGVSRAAVWKWIHANRVPATKTLLFEEISGVSRHELRPDVFGPSPAPKQAA